MNRQARKPHWFKSSFSGAEGGQCVEVAAVPAGVLVRDSKRSAGPVLALAPTAWARFVEQAARG
ncbi:DUF397 domain-containing protein [Streptomyces somaliensis DSM 40738]|uniref:DUF397 domain-containing protein n=1 Tax=Streptomyces somaliensis (strain ATCC 33201 / DSM 40738 / JCM 12659 / KCTC 9044 / NCTC 11332 / NRRL B-12077 / IP 733) TaxID=1134445 RepID=A0AA44DBX2_STRE0|nr:DUF397 domain-containing protein [Streptomyces somaliensis]MCQ0025344.1 DUF397 domain-containing protein [Streptomyces somaliensis DSM 40738]NKY13545.1 DUF397 domain-containing protein [Streptomyces somaliensis DSM 40738]